METQKLQVESAPASDTKATEPKRLSFKSLTERLTAPEVEERRREREAEDAKRAAWKKQDDLDRALTTLGNRVGDRYADCTLGNFQVTHQQQGRVADAVREYAELLWENLSDGIGVVFYGPVGTGKDHLAHALAQLATEGGQSVDWVNGQSWFGKMRDNIDADKSEAAAVAELVSPQLLVLSDPLPPIGSLTQYQSTMLYRVIDARYSRKLATICTVNVKDDTEADERIGAATWDRLCHGTWKLHCNWPSYRKPARVV